MTARRGPIPPFGAVVLAALAGFSSTAYELLWARALMLELGGPLAAFTIVITAFMAGLSMGALFFGAIAPGASGSLRLLAALQAGITVLGLFSLRAPTLLRGMLQGLHREPRDLVFFAVEIAAAGLFCAVAAFLAGGSIPLIFGAARSPRWGGGSLYGALTAATAAGAALGAFSSGYLMLPRIGLSASLALNTSIAALTAASAWIQSRFVIDRSVTTSPFHDPASGPSAPAHPLRVLLPLAVVGASVTSLEVVWARLSFLSFGSSAQAGSLVLTTVILGLSFGGLWGGRLARRSGDPLRPLSIVVVTGAAAIAVSDPLLGRMPMLATRVLGFLSPAGDPSHTLGLASLFLMMLIVTAPPCLLFGASFPLGLEWLVRHRCDPSTRAQVRSTGIVSAVVSLGHMIGGPLAYLSLTTEAGSREVLLGSALMVAAGALGLSPGWGGVARAGATAGLILLLGPSLPWDPAVLSSGPFIYGSIYNAEGRHRDLPFEEILARRGSIVQVEEGPHGLVTVRRTPDGTLSLQIDGKTDASTGADMRTQSLVAHLPLLVHASSRSGPDPRVLLVGLGSGVSAAAVLTHPIDRLIILEISPEVVNATASFQSANRGVLDDPSVALEVIDARSWLIFVRDRYDVIVSQPSNPWVAGQAPLFTREFFEHAARRLTPDGVMCQWLQGHGLGLDEFRSVIATFRDVFSHVSLWEESTAGGDYLLLGSHRPLSMNLERLERFMGLPDVAADLRRIAVDEPADLLALHVMDGEHLDRYVEGATIQTDDLLSLEFTAPRSLYKETLGDLLASLERHREPADLARPDPDLIQALVRRSRASRAERDWAAGLGLTTTRPADVDMLHALAYLRAGMRDEAVAIVEEASARRPADPFPHTLLAHLSMSLGDTDRALRELATVAALRPDDARPWMFLARALHAAGRPHQALEHNARALDRDPDIAVAHSDRCGMLLSVGDAPSAEAACRDALDLDPELAPARANLGVIHARRGRLDLAESEYRAALSLDPDLADARFNLAVIHDRTHRPDEGLVTLEPLIERREPEAILLAARLSIAAGRREEARRYIDWIRRLDPATEELDALEGMLRKGGP